MAAVILLPGREKSMHRRHPWIFSGAVMKTAGEAAPGETVEILAADGNLLGRGAYSPGSKIRVRAWTFSRDESIGPDFFRRRLEEAYRNRLSVIPAGDTAFRMVHAESDGLPGVIVDRYGDFLVGQFLTAGAEYWKATIVSLLDEIFPNQGVYERSDGEVRLKEDLPRQTGVLSGREPPDLIEIREGTLKFLVDIRGGHKTGFYLDQRDNRIALMPYADGAHVLNCFSYTGAFAVAALTAGAREVVNVDSSADALALARNNVELNMPGGAGSSYITGDVFTVLREYRDAGRRFDLVILDPPKFAESRKHLEKAARGYKDINFLAMTLLRPEGVLVSFSCSGLMTRDLFEKAVAWAALDAGREARILKRLEQSADHATVLSFPEAGYLKGIVCRVR